MWWLRIRVLVVVSFTNTKLRNTDRSCVCRSNQSIPDRSTEYVLLLGFIKEGITGGRDNWGEEIADTKG